MDQKERNKATADKNLSRQAKAETGGFGAPGTVYNDEGAQIQNPGPVDEPGVGDDKPIGWRQLGDRVTRPEPGEVKAYDTPSPNPSDKQGGEPLTPSEPGSASIQRVADKNESLSREDTTKKAAENAKPKGGK